MSNTPTAIFGGVVVDDRGSVRFVNDFDFQGVKRFYQVQNHRSGFIRAWHGHMDEGKYIYVPKGSALVCFVKLYQEDFDGLEHDLTHRVDRCVLSSGSPSILYVPPGYANGFKSLEEDTIVMFFSTSTLEESSSDDFRFPYDKWNVWEEDFR